MLRPLCLLPRLGLVSVLFSAVSFCSAAEKTTVLVRVAPEAIGKRATDERPAEFVLEAAHFAKGRALDPGSLQVVRIDPKSGKEVSGPLPVRWYDNAIPYDFPEFEQNAHSTDGIKRTFAKRPRWGDFYNLIGDGKSGRLVWTHTQKGNRASHYAISFELLPEGKTPERLPPRGLVGDGSHRCADKGSTTTGMIHSRVCVADWDGDGLPDLLVGGSKGHILVYLNRGTKQKPAFPYARLVNTADGQPLDVGWSSAPLVVDWDGDGVQDLLTGCERNRVLFYRNEGTNKAPRLVNKGFVMVDGKPLELPIDPVPKSPPGVYPLDYYPVLEAVDWNGDGKLDLLAGGFITGRIFFYENVGKHADATPKLAFRGPLEADGKPLNVGDWAAAPCAADFDGDGDLDLISGNMPLTAGGGDSADAEHFLRYYENVGTRTHPKLVERPFPKKGRFPNSALGTPRAVDLNGDGLFDLVVSANENIYLYYNVGTRHAPLWEVHAEALPGYGGSAPLPTFGLQFVDWFGDGKLDLLAGLVIYRNVGGQYRHESLLPPGNRIDHPAPRGDGWTFTQLADLDGDGKLDLLYGTHEGNIWLHSHLGDKPPRFDEKGKRLETTDGKPIRVGPEDGKKMDFDVLQGARTTFAAADFDGDGLLDLVVGDTYGCVRLFKNAGTKREPRFAPATTLGKMPIRMVPTVTDWDGDGRLDVVGAAANGDVEWWRNLGGGKFAAAAAIKFPPLPYSPTVAVVDWNQDGDADLIVGTAYGYFCWIERSFLERGYAKAERVTRRE